MCTVCGCSDQHGEPSSPLTIHFGQGAAGTSLPGVSQAKTVLLEKNILDANNLIAEKNRAHFKAHGIRSFNLLSSPGSGKTTLLCRTLNEIKALPGGGIKASVIEGDQQTRVDAERIQATGAPVIQVNTGKGCHLDARMVSVAFSKLHVHDHPPSLEPNRKPSHAAPTPFDTLTFHRYASLELLFIENVGNLVCPALWDLGENAKVVMLSVTEGEDKPLKYPDMFQAADLLLINKIDLLPYVDFDPDRAFAYARSMNPNLQCLRLSATTGEGMPAWMEWLIHGQPTHEPSGDEQALLQRRIAALEAELQVAREALAKGV